MGLPLGRSRARSAMKLSLVRPPSIEQPANS
jgi:hypothetical protein